MDILILWFLSSVLAAAVAAYLRLLFEARPPEPFWFAPVLLLIIGLVLVFAAHISVSSLPGVAGQLASSLMIAFGGWMLLGWRR